MRPIKRIFIHCSDSWWGTSDVICEWHRARGWRGVGYHFTVNNGFPTYKSWVDYKYQLERDGLIEVGRDIRFTGAHVFGHNLDSIGICLIGRRLFSYKQLSKLTEHVHLLCNQYKIPMDREHIKGHYELDSGKTCPNIDMRWLLDLFRKMD